MLGMVAVGGPGPEIATNWDFWLPAYMLLSFLLIVIFVRTRITTWTGVASLVGGTLWAWLDNAVGVLPAGAVAVLVAFFAGGIARRVAARRTG